MAGNKNLAAQVESIMAEAAESIRGLVRDALRGEVGGLLGSILGTEATSVSAPAKRGRKPGSRKPGPKPGKKKPGPRPGKKAAGKPGRKPGKKRAARGTAGPSPEKVKALASLVADKGSVRPADARKALKLAPVQMQHVAREAAAQKLIKVTGAGRGTQYEKA